MIKKFIPYAFLLLLGIVLTLIGNIATQIIGVSISVAAICSGMFALIRDEMKRYHERFLQEQNQKLSLGAMSHMANVTFDKHVEFCEAYINKFREILGKMFRDGASVKCLDYAGDLWSIREKYALWINEEINAPLLQLEAALRKIGANEHLVKSIPVSDKRSKVIDEIYTIFSEICEIKEDEEKSEAEKERANQIASSKVLQHLRDLLGAEDFVKLRKSLMKKAIEGLN